MNEFINTIDLLGDDAVCDSIIDRTITEFKDNKITIVGRGAFQSCRALTTVDFPLVTSIVDYAFNNCSALTTADLPLATSIGEYAFKSCSALTTADFPLATSIGREAFQSCIVLTTVDFPLVTSIQLNAFRYCSALTTADFPLATSIGSAVFRNCGALTALILRKTDTVCVLHNRDAFTNAGSCYIYVPSALVDSYKAASNWSDYASRFRALEDYTVDGTTTGELDPNKI